MINEEDAILIVENNDVERLVKNANAIFENGEFGTVANIVAGLGTVEQLEILYKAGCDLSYVHEHHYTLLETAVLHRRYDMVCALLKPEYNVRKNRYEIAYAAAIGNCDMIDYMSQCGIDSFGVDESGRNGLHWAAQEDYYEVCELLLKLKCCTNQIDCSGQTPLYIAAAEGNLRIVKRLIEAGAHVDLCGDSPGTTPFMIACSCHNYEEGNVLLQNGSDIDAQDGEGYTALMLAIIKEDDEVVNYLLSKGADITVSRGNEISAKDYMTDSELRKREADILYG